MVRPAKILRLFTPRQLASQTPSLACREYITTATTTITKTRTFEHTNRTRARRVESCHTTTYIQCTYIVCDGNRQQALSRQSVKHLPLRHNTCNLPRTPLLHWTQTHCIAEGQTEDSSDSNPNQTKPNQTYNKQTNEQTNKQTNKQRAKRQIDRQTDRQTDSERDREGGMEGERES